MSDNKNTILAIVLSAIVLIVWQFFFVMPQEKLRLEKAREEQLLRAKNPAATTQPATTPAQPGAPAGSRRSCPHQTPRPSRIW